MRPNLVQYTGMLRIKYVEFVWKYTGEWYVFDTYQLHVKALIYYCNINIWMEIEKSKVLIQFLLIFRQSGDVLFFLYARRLRGYTSLYLHCWVVKGHFFSTKQSALSSSYWEPIFSETPLTALNFLSLDSCESRKIIADQFWNCGDQRWQFPCSLSKHLKKSNL